MVKSFTNRTKPSEVIGRTDEVNPYSYSREVERNLMPPAQEKSPKTVVKTESKQESSKTIAEAKIIVETNPAKIIESRNTLNEILTSNPSPEQQFSVKNQLAALSKEWLFSKNIYDGDTLCGRYKVEIGDTFAVLGRKFKVPYEILMQINNISNAKSLRAGDSIKVINGPFHCIIYRSAFTMDLYLQDTYVRSFQVGLGKPGMETPTGRWIVKPGGKLISPTWTDPDTGKTYESTNPNYPLGSRWIALDGVEGAAKGAMGFAIHGTKEPQQIGKADSRGCIRLHDEDVKLIYNLLTPGLSQVTVIE